ncbi:hypothetical protein CAXC1_120053 [Candidatus Xenohaliotis californiensis]|uniref:Uncharacterized protein n=1 Tax=Candidatus Xenohaliotis californiensis TaxID=84677 RepID=A0ABM9N712_9RICK|nr:hypothetical protein CAXC1_120053 [Candidatus Xenohaliotis californiensis]
MHIVKLDSLVSLSIKLMSSFVKLYTSAHALYKCLLKIL